LAKTIIHIIDSLTTGGAEILLKNTVSLLKDCHHVIIFLYPDETLVPQFDEDVEFFCVRHRGWSSIARTTKEIKKIIKSKDPVLVHSHLFVSTICARLATPRRIPLFNTLHSVYSIDAFEKNRMSVWVERLTLKKRHFLIGVSDYVLKDYLRFVPFKGKTFVLYNFLPQDHFKRVEYKQQSGILKCVAVGTLKEAKNYPYLLRVFSNLKSELIALDIFGDGNLRAQLQKSIDDNNLPVTLLGTVADIKEKLLDYDLFIQVSEHEGFGLSVIEAIGSGLPVLLSDIPVFREITRGYAHFLPLDNDAIASERLRTLINDVEVRRGFIQTSFEYCASMYNERQYIKNLLSIYNEATSKN
jgi:glycosyltransferase involved in cell wall biosynthesis